jgi:hypothetical protein
MRAMRPTDPGNHDHRLQMSNTSLPNHMTTPAMRSITKTSSAIAAPAVGAAALLAIGAATGGVSPELGALPGPGTPGLRGASVERHQHAARSNAAGPQPTAPAPTVPALPAAPAPGPRAPVHPRSAVHLPIRPDRVSRHRAEVHRVPSRTRSSTPVGERRPHAPLRTTPTTRPQPSSPREVATGGAGLPAASPAQPPTAPQPAPAPQSPPPGDANQVPQGQNDQGEGQGSGSGDPSSTGNSSSIDNS